MSNSIWHKPGYQPAVDDKAKVSRDGGLIYWTAHGWNRPGEDVHDIGVEWAYVEDVLAQADKAERLQKAVDLALVGLANSQTYATMSGNHGLSDMLYDKYIKPVILKKDYPWRE